jgi:hypothetical protein
MAGVMCSGLAVLSTGFNMFPLFRKTTDRCIEIKEEDFKINVGVYDELIDETQQPHGRRSTTLACL